MWGGPRQMKKSRLGISLLAPRARNSHLGVEPQRKARRSFQASARCATGQTLKGASSLPVMTVGNYFPFATTVWDYIHRAMPRFQEGSLSADDVYSLTAYLLYRNGIIKETD